MHKRETRVMLQAYPTERALSSMMFTRMATDWAGSRPKVRHRYVIGPGNECAVHAGRVEVLRGSGDEPRVSDRVIRLVNLP